MKLFLAALTIWSLPFFGVSCGSATLQEPQPNEVKPTPTASNDTVTLTNEQPTASFPVGSNLLSDPPETLEVSITKVSNPAARSVDIFVYLSSRADVKDTDARVSVGNFSLYPADRPARFMLNAADAFRRLAETRKPSDIKELHLVFELQRQADTQPSSPVEVTIAGPTWKREKG